MDSSLGFQPAVLPCRFGACQTSQSFEVTPYNKSPSLHTYTTPPSHTYPPAYIQTHPPPPSHTPSHTHFPSLTDTPYHTHMLSITHTHTPLLVCFSSEPSLLTQWLIYQNHDHVLTTSTLVRQAGSSSPAVQPTLARDTCWKHLPTLSMGGHRRWDETGEAMKFHFCPCK